MFWRRKRSEEKPENKLDENTEPVDVLQPEFWTWSSGKESYGDWLQRIRTHVKAPYPVLASFLDDERTEMRALALNVLVYLQWQEPTPPDLAHRAIDLLANDPSGAVRERAMTLCGALKLSEVLPILKAIQQDEELLTQLCDQPGVLKNGGRGEFERRLYRTRRELGYIPPPPPAILEASKPLPEFPASCEGYHVGAEHIQTPLLPENGGPPCPVCSRSLAVLVRLQAEFGPQDAPALGLPFYRCLWCYMHEPFYVRIEPTIKCLNTPEADEYDEDRAEGQKVSPSGVLWHGLESPREVQWRLKKGGEPAWLQNPEEPDCLSCRGAMTFVLQLSYDEWHFPIPEWGGVNYGFWCGKCRITATLFQCT